MVSDKFFKIAKLRSIFAFSLSSSLTLRNSLFRSCWIHYVILILSLQQLTVTYIYIFFTSMQKSRHAAFVFTNKHDNYFAAKWYRLSKWTELSIKEAWKAANWQIKDGIAVFYVFFARASALIPRAFAAHKSCNFSILRSRALYYPKEKWKSARSLFLAVYNMENSGQARQTYREALVVWWRPFPQRSTPKWWETALWQMGPFSPIFPHKKARKG